MTPPRIYTPQTLESGLVRELEPAATRHLLQVLRLRPGSHLILFNGDGREYRARLVESQRRSARVAIDAGSDIEPPPALEIALGLCLPKGERMDYAIQKAVELGVSSIIPLLSSRTVVKLRPERAQKRLSHWQGVVTSACEQSGRRRLPELGAVTPLEQWLAATNSDTAVLLDHRAGNTLNQLTPPQGGVRLLVGPEGGLSEQERSHAVDHGFQAIRLGPRILRTETAPLAAISVMQILWGDFGS